MMKLLLVVATSVALIFSVTDLSGPPQRQNKKKEEAITIGEKKI
jgi:hypothetical protein